MTSSVNNSSAGASKSNTPRLEGTSKSNTQKAQGSQQSEQAQQAKKPKKKVDARTQSVFDEIEKNNKQAMKEHEQFMQDMFGDVL